jgi:hypothetical protein
VEGRKYRRNERTGDCDRRSLARSLENIVQFRKSRGRVCTKGKIQGQEPSYATKWQYEAERMKVKMVLWGRRYYLNKKYYYLNDIIFIFQLPAVIRCIH